MIPAVHTRHVCCVYVYIMHVLVWVFETLVVSVWRSFIRQVALRCAQLGASRCDCSRLCLVHTSMYDRARPRPRLSDQAGVSLCKSYEIVDSMVEVTCLQIWEFITHIIRLVCGR